MRPSTDDILKGAFIIVALVMLVTLPVERVPWWAALTLGALACLVGWMDGARVLRDAVAVGASVMTVTLLGGGGRVPWWVPPFFAAVTYLWGRRDEQEQARRPA